MPDPTLPRSTVIIGAGIAGLSAARALGDQGLDCIIYDKGRGIGGRVATRRVTLADGSAVQFDHGAQFATAKGAGFSAAMAGLGGALAHWNPEGRTQMIGTPSMSSLARALGPQAVQNAQVTALHQASDGLWHIGFAGGSHILARRLVLTIPAPQLAALLGEGHVLVRAAAHVALQPCLTLMLAAPRDRPAPFIAQRSSEADLAWIAQDSSKQGRPATYTTWVAQAGPEFSQRHLDKSAQEIAALMVPMLCSRLGMAAGDAVYSAAHRWRYAKVQTPLGAPFLRSQDSTLYLGGDWCLGPRIEAAWDSGAAIAADIIARGA